MLRAGGAPTGSDHAQALLLRPRPGHCGPPPARRRAGLAGRPRPAARGSRTRLRAEQLHRTRERHRPLLREGRRARSRALAERRQREWHGTPARVHARAARRHSRRVPHAAPRGPRRRFRRRCAGRRPLVERRQPGGHLHRGEDRLADRARAGFLGRRCAAPLLGRLRPGPRRRTLVERRHDRRHGPRARLRPRHCVGVPDRGRELQHERDRGLALVCRERRQYRLRALPQRRHRGRDATGRRVGPRSVGRQPPPLRPLPQWCRVPRPLEPRARCPEPLAQRWQRFRHARGRGLVGRLVLRRRGLGAERQAPLFRLQPRLWHGARRLGRHGCRDAHDPRPEPRARSLLAEPVRRPRRHRVLHGLRRQRGTGALAQRWHRTRNLARGRPRAGIGQRITP